MIAEEKELTARFLDLAGDYLGSGYRGPERQYAFTGDPAPVSAAAGGAALSAAAASSAGGGAALSAAPAASAAAAGVALSAAAAGPFGGAAVSAVGGGAAASAAPVSAVGGGAAASAADGGAALSAAASAVGGGTPVSAAAVGGGVPVSAVGGGAPVPAVGGGAALSAAPFSAVGGGAPVSAAGPFGGDGGGADSLELVAAEIGGCTACPLCKTRGRTVPGEGAERPLVMVIGEGPGAEEDATGRPFVGPAGRLLDEMLASRGQIGLYRDTNCFIANVVKCRPPNNRDPLPEEVAACAPFLARQIALLRPRLILALGRSSSQSLLQTGDGIGRLRGRFYDYGGIPLLPTYHPSALLRNSELKRPAWEDLKNLRAKLAELVPGFAATGSAEA